ncbi:hypothetical protein N7524_001168 [Penicillium chrysogenum]|nr:hypothetical protein N7524_001168 [Penicillium chrysogenum]
MLFSFGTALCALGTASALVISERGVETRDVSGTAHVYLKESNGPSQHYASGYIYGIPDTPNQIPDHFYSDIAFQYTRAGGAQTPESKGWIGGQDDYTFRWESTLSNYRTARQQGGQFILLVHDLWGADSLQSEDAPFPGDNDDWSFYDEFLSALISDIKDNDLIDGVTIDIWNEPDGRNFWDREQDQYLLMWGRATARFNKTFTSTEMLKNYDALLAKYSATREGLVNINEYGHPDEQNPSGSAWWIAQLERANIFGCRANWASAYALHDFMAQLLGKPGAGTDDYDPKATGYYPNGEYQVYKYYASSMVGDRIKTETTMDTNGDVYATVDAEGRVLRLLAGARTTTGTWSIQLEELSALGLPKSGEVGIHTYEFPGSDDPYARLDEPVDLGTVTHKYSEDSLTFPIYSENVYDAWAFEIKF